MPSLPFSTASCKVPAQDVGLQRAKATLQGAEGCRWQSCRGPGSTGHSDGSLGV